MSASPLIADIQRMSWHVRFVPIADIRAWLTGITSTPGNTRASTLVRYMTRFCRAVSRNHLFACKHAPGADDVPEVGLTRLTQSVVRATACQPLIQF